MMPDQDTDRCEQVLAEAAHKLADVMDAEYERIMIEKIRADYPCNSQAVFDKRVALFRDDKSRVD